MSKFDWRKPEEATDFTQIESGTHPAMVVDVLQKPSNYADEKTGKFPDEVEVRLELVDYPGVVVRWWARTPPRKIGAGFNKLGAMLNALGEAGMLPDGEMDYDALIGLRVAVTLHSTVATSGERVGQPVLKVLAIEPPKKPKAAAPATPNGKTPRTKVAKEDVDAADDLPF